MAAAAETKIETQHLQTPVYEEQLVLEVPELYQDEIARLQAAHFIGAVAVGAWEHSSESTKEALAVKPIESLHEAIKAATKGNQLARKMVEINVATDVIERTIKTGHVMKVDLMVNEAGDIQQHGQSLDSVQANSLRYASDSWQMRERVEAETRNAFRIKQHYQQGTLEDYYFVVFSMAADNMTKESMDEAGFFTDTMSCAFQVTSSEGNRLVTESAFIAGVNKPGDARHDKSTIIGIAEKLDLDLSGKTATEVIDTPVLIHKKLLPNGAIDLVRLADSINGTFFGEDKPQQDYLDYRQKCIEREQNFQPKVDEIVAELIAEAPHITSPAMAVQRLNKISGKHMVEHAILDKSIDARVFGPTSAKHVERARWYREVGDITQSQSEAKQAIKTDTSRSCPTGMKNGESENGGSESSDEDEYGSLQFKCRKGHTNTRPRGKLIEKCQICNESVRC